ncbi:hypothetical protein [Pseudoxanthomonas wuyuanensis]
MRTLGILMLALRSLLTIMLGVAVVALVNQAGGALADLVRFPKPGQGRLAWDLLVVFAAGTLGAWVAVRLAPRAPCRHALYFFALSLAIAVFAVMKLGADWPGWFSAGILLSLPLQVWMGASWAIRRNAG